MDNKLLLKRILVIILIFFMIPINPLVNGDNLKDTLLDNIDIIQDHIIDNKYDMIIITPLWFYKALQPLVDHKNNHSIKTKCVTLRDIYNDIYFKMEGRDDAEKVKYFIKSAFDEWGIKYVLLVGGRKGGLFEPTWWVPVRYSNLDDYLCESYLCDLYFADIYDENGDFSSWDSNENGVFAEWNSNGKDILDMYPEVYLGRLACRNIDEVETMVEKIITYENTANGSEWLNKYIGVGGDTWPEYNDFYEGEIITEAVFNYLEGFEASYLWTSTGTFTCKQDIINEINKGCGFLVFSGHGTPRIWLAHPPNDEKWITAPTTYEMDELRNGEKLPIVLVSGCNNAQFDVSPLNIIKGILEEGIRYFYKYPGIPHGFWKYDWVPRCWSWSMASQKYGGCIAILGNTGLSYDKHGEECLTGYDGFLLLQFFKSYSEGKDTLGETYATQLKYYLDKYPPMEDRINCKVAQEWVLLGDPSLKIGGYSNNL